MTPILALWNLPHLINFVECRIPGKTQGGFYCVKNKQLSAMVKKTEGYATRWIQSISLAWYWKVVQSLESHLHGYLTGAQFGHGSDCHPFFPLSGHSEDHCWHGNQKLTSADCSQQVTPGITHGYQGNLWLPCFHCDCWGRC